jgi:hypothetical protein
LALRQVTNDLRFSKKLAEITLREHSGNTTSDASGGCDRTQSLPFGNSRNSLHLSQSVYGRD